MSNISYALDADGVGLITWDMPGRSMNVLDEASIREFGAVADAAIADPAVRGVVVTSAKDAFIAGADLEWILRLTESGKERTFAERAGVIFEQCMKLQSLFRRIEKSGKPFAAAINGTALGGGLELCLACHYRVATDERRAQLGLPEAKLGLLPGAGGTQRLLRMIGALEALSLLLDGRSLSPQEAERMHIVDRIVPRAEVVEAAKAWIRQTTAEDAVKPWDKVGFVMPGIDPRTQQGSGAFAAANALQRKKTFGNYPALDAIQSLIYDGFVVPIETALRLEVKYFTKLLLGANSKNMIRTQFVNMQKANKLTRRPASIPTRRIAKIGVLGAGMMGAGIAHVAAKAGIDVVLIDRDQASAENGHQHARAGLAAAVAKGDLDAAAAEAILNRILPTTDYAELAGADLVIEAVFEDREVKAQVTRAAEQVIGSTAVFASNTSTIPISSLAEASLRPERFIGLHFFSPVEKMPLLEIIRGRQTGDEALAIAMDLARQIRKTPIVVNDSRGFYTSRVFAMYTNEAINMVAEGVAPALIENAGKAIGMPVAPLALNDEIALDLVYRVNAQTKKDLGANYRERPSDKLVVQMVDHLGRLGKKAGKGFYEYPKDGRKYLWPGIETLAHLAEHQPDPTEIKSRLLTIQALEAARCFEEGVITDPADADIGAVLGWGFAPWTGGPLSYIDTVGADAFVTTCDRLSQAYGEAYKPNDLLRRMAHENRGFYAETPAV
jgi:3-hydroxyacyl-CoA dehydrogenase/enoyl-CoA hydratase/3-hydroxybutyryl-CoA epimerase